MPSIATQWRRKQYLREIKEGFKEGIEKFLRQELRRGHSISKIVKKIKNLNEKLWYQFLEDFLVKVAKAELLGLDITSVDRFYAKKLFDYILRNEDLNYYRVKEKVKGEIKNKLQEFAKVYYLKTEEEAVSVFGRDYEIAKKIGFNVKVLYEKKKDERKYYFATIDKQKFNEVKFSLKGILEVFKEEIKEELLLSEKYLGEKEIKALKVWLLGELEKMKHQI